MGFDSEAAFFCQQVQARQVRARRVLAIGCGGADEPSFMAARLGGTVIGVDLTLGDRTPRPGVHLVRADARALPFRAEVFDAVYCYHVLEHVPGPSRATDEAARVTKPGGVGLFGTPNKARVVGYLGGRATTAEKIRWNLADYGFRLRRRWSNEQGAHAGFRLAELDRLVRRSFGSSEPVSQSYYEHKYANAAPAWRMAFRIGLAALLAPSVYVIGRRGHGQAPAAGGSRD
ncbi:MAG TPA: class I SAM-dependent methyltransferase [Candidatus Eisenbacteria bacterium]|nr:class I SAM-dependent methyltransferase [Candidatus Eisenbacteria bacterium]